MYPPQTSLIPVTVALTRFFENYGFAAFNLNYPFWYLGSTPYKFLIGPIVPIFVHYLRLILGLKLEIVTLFNILIYIIIFFYLLSGIGWLILFKKLSQGSREGNPKSEIRNPNKLRFIILNSVFLILYLIFPWKYLAGLALGEASITIARSFLPFVLISFWVYLVKRTNSKGIICIITTSINLLISTNILPILLVGLISLTLAYSYQDGKFKKLWQNLHYPLLLVLAAIILVTAYYSPAYWVTILANPSIGGASTIKVILRVIDLFKGAIPLVLAMVAVYFSGKIKSRYTVFTFTWLFAFLFLTIFRFIGDPDFWMDWTSWFWEIEIGLFLLGSKLILSGTHYLLTLFKRSNYPNHLNYRVSTYATLFGFILLYLGLTGSFYNKLGRLKLVSGQPVPELMASLSQLSQISGGETVYLSGSTVFWADALYDLRQIRGGKDEVAVNSEWDKASWEIREGQDPAKTLGWIKKLNIKYVLVHESGSVEYYHDFKNLAKWDQIGKKIWEDRGDIIYQF